MAFSTMTNRATGYTVVEDDWDKLTGNFDFFNTAFCIPLFPRSSGDAPISGVQAAALSIVQSGGAGTAKPQWPILAFDKDTDEGRMWSGHVPTLYASTFILKGQFYMPAATSGTVCWAAQFACWSDTDATVTSKVFDTVNSSGAITVPGTALTIKAFTLTMTNASSAAALDSYALSFIRDISEDTAAEDAYLKSLALYFSLQ